MSSYRVAIIGTGLTQRPDGEMRRGIAYHHGRAWKKHPETEIVALADIQRENAQAYADYFEITPEIFLDYHEMLAEAKPDIVSVCVWTGLHPRMVTAAAEAGVKAIHCEKPMAPTWGEAKRMAAVCDEHGVQLTFNHQRRFGGLFRKAKELCDGGAIGELQRLEGWCPNLMDWGTHWLDMFLFYNHDEKPVWVLGQIDKHTDHSVFGLQMEDQAVCWFEMANGVAGILTTGSHAHGPSNRLVGSEGILDLRSAGAKSVHLLNGDGWQEIEVTEGLEGQDAFDGAIFDLVAALREQREPELSARKALQCTEVIFATYESSRRRGRVELPLETEDSALLTMIDEGLIGVARHG